MTSATTSYRRYSPIEERANFLTHGTAALLSLTGLVLMVMFSTKHGDAYHLISCSIYGTTLLLLYSASTLYHLTPRDPLKLLFRRLDHAMIYLLIAGTYTPFTLNSLRGPWGWSIFGIVWTIALAGLVLEFTLNRRLRWLPLSLYLSLGWLIIVAAKPLLTSLEPGGLLLLLSGGLLYSFGVVFYLWESLRFQHAIWHLFVIGGSLCHFLAVFFYVTPAAS